MAEDKNTVQTPKERHISGDSTKWKNWMSVLAPTTCLECAALHGTIYPMSMFIYRLIFVSYDHAQTFYELTEYNGGSINEEIHG